VKRKGASASEGSVEQNRGPTHRNRIVGSAGRTTRQRTGKSISIKGQQCKSGGRARKVVKLNLGGLCPVSDWGLSEPRGEPIGIQESAEGVVSEQGRSA
jgi:hypothetical protein